MHKKSYHLISSSFLLVIALLLLSPTIYAQETSDPSKRYVEQFWSRANKSADDPDSGDINYLFRKLDYIKRKYPQVDAGEMERKYKELEQRVASDKAASTSSSSSSSSTSKTYTPSSTPSSSSSSSSSSTSHKSERVIKDKSQAMIEKYVSEFWFRYNKSQSNPDSYDISYLRRKIEAIQSKDPNYNVSELVAKLNSLDGKSTQMAQERTSSNDLRNETITLLKALAANKYHFGTRLIDYDDSDQNLAELNAAFAQWQAKDRSSVLNNPSHILVQSALETAKESYLRIDADEVIKEATEMFHEGSYDQLAFTERLLDVGYQITKEPSLLTEKQKIAAAARDIGSRAGAKQRVDEIRKLQRSKIRMAQPMIYNAEIEAKFKKSLVDMGWNEQVLRVVLTASDWSVDTELGRIVSRKFRGQIAVKQASGECQLYDWTIIEDYNGSSFSGARRYSHNPGPIDCENVNP